jgi:predicted phage baseplate assembly protein
VAVNANVVAATNGETTNEILGSGDATNDALEFTLKQSPLTYVSSPLNHGAVSTLQVWVNNMRWHEVGNLLNSGPRDRVFITQTNSNQKVTVQFGDGVEGERTPTGQMNIRAVYRKGIGSAGNVQSGQLSQALDRPQGLKGVTNPDPAAGGADPDTAADARASAPLQVLTLGRVVSLEDYQNYALAFAGIAQALATWTWNGRTRGVFLTVAGANGAVFQPDDQILTSLKDALWSVGNPYVPIQIASFIPVLFEAGANVKVDQTDYDPTAALAQVWQSLSNSFSFAERQMGQGVAQSEIIAVIQQTPGVIAVELTVFKRRGQITLLGAPLPPVLLAASPTPGQEGTPQGAEMLLLDPASQANFEVWS